MKIERRAMSKKQRYPRIYIWIENESIIGNFFNRHDRPYEMYRKEILPAISTSIPELQTATYYWSQKAGCSCGCSPAFIVRNSKLYEDLHVTV